MGLTACRECGILVSMPEHLSLSQYRCPNCNALLHRRGQPFSHVIIMAAASLLLFVPLTFLPVLSLNIMGMQSEATLFEALWQLYRDGYHIIAVLSLMTGLLLPPIMMVLLLLILVPLRWGYRPQKVALYYRIYDHAREWGMAEVYLISIMVAIIKLSKMATLHVGLGLYMFVFFFITFYITTVWFNPDDIWDDDALLE